MLARSQQIAKIGSWTLDLATGDVHWSDELYRLLGFDPHAGGASGERFLERMHLDDRTRFIYSFEQAVRERRPFECYWRAVPSEGVVLSMHSRGELEVNEEGEPERMFGTTQDVTARKRVEAALRASEKSLAAELAGMAQLHEISTRLVQDGDATSLLQAIVDAAIAITVADMGSIQLAEGATMKLVASRGMELADGMRALLSTPLVSRSGRVVGMLTTQYLSSRQPAERDVRVLDLLARQAADWIERTQAQVERDRLLERERQARAEAERAARLKDEFLATLSHELRTPLSAILGWADVIKLGIGQPDKVLRAAEVISRNARAQGQLIGDLLDLSRIITGKMRLAVEPVDLSAVLDAAIETVRPAADARRVRVRCVTDASIPVIHGDAPRLQQILWNLLSNAVKFTPEGGHVEVVLARAGSQVQVSVTDTGIGIGAEFLPYVFDRFRQAVPSATREHGGLGIGLALVRELAELHGGQVQASSDGAGKGSTFVVRFPLAPPSIEEEPPKPVRALANDVPTLVGVRVLLVDDEPDALEVIQEILVHRQASVTVVTSVEEALAALEHQTFDVLLSDIGMPRRDGYDLITSMRLRGLTTPAAAVTAFARSEDRTRALLAGFQAHLTKPLEASELLATVASLSGRIQRPGGVS
jgi:signal transduction histidine kinase